MRFVATIIVVSGLMIFGTLFFFLGGGKLMSLQNEESEAKSAVLSSDAPRSGGFETATFALG